MPSWLRAIHDLEAKTLTTRAMAIKSHAGSGPDEQLRGVSYLNIQGDKGAQSTFTYWGLFAMASLTNLESEVVYQRYFGEPIRALAHLQGRFTSATHPTWRNKTVDDRGRLLTAVNCSGYALPVRPMMAACRM